ncbi:MAG: diguanylate cyclase [Lachnospiraceae bacterium]|nr:diguanylate cyclase [Lachnospiraceae bacterium]
MYYSAIGIVALILHFIINRDALKRIEERPGVEKAWLKEAKRYRYFLISLTLYYIIDIAWGILYEYHGIPALFPIIYSDTVFYFIFRFLTMLTWIRFVVAYLDKRDRPSRAILYGVWTLFTLSLIYLMVNRFHHFIFSFNENNEYIAEPGRYIAFLLQIILYLITSLYLLYIARGTEGTERVRFTAVGLTTLVMLLFQVIQLLYPLLPIYSMGLIIGTSLVHSFVEEDEKQDKEIYDNIARSLAEVYEVIYYIDIESGKYREFSKSSEYDALNVPTEYRDFFSETRINIRKYVYPEDREFAESLYYSEVLEKNLEGRDSFSYKYRLMTGDEARYYRFTVMRSNDDKHLILYGKDINDEITAESILMEHQKQNITFSQIAESLASNYDEIYYVDVENGAYVGYGSNDMYGQLEIRHTGDDFFSESISNIPKVIHRNDRDMLTEFVSRDNMISAMEGRKRDSIVYRIAVDGRNHYVRLTVRYSSDRTHFIIGIENVDAEVRKEKEVLKALNTEKKLARRDELTGVKNKTAYRELEQAVQTNMDKDMDYLPFAIIVCDTNDLKKINDSEGHVAGDGYIKASAKLLCDIFVHSPVFRVGGDEFVVFLRGNDYLARQELMEKLHNTVRENMKKGSGPVLAAGVSEYIPETDSLVSDIFDRADREMYEDKQFLKRGGSPLSRVQGEK